MLFMLFITTTAQMDQELIRCTLASVVLHSDENTENLERIILGYNTGAILEPVLEKLRRIQTARVRIQRIFFKCSHSPETKAATYHQTCQALHESIVQYEKSCSLDLPHVGMAQEMQKIHQKIPLRLNYGSEEHIKELMDMLLRVQRETSSATLHFDEDDVKAILTKINELEHETYGSLKEEDIYSTSKRKSQTTATTHPTATTATKITVAGDIHGKNDDTV